jgi:transcription termination/antitermination protein NusA
VKTLDDLADLASDELIEILGNDVMDEATANEVIMAARAHWFADEQDAQQPQEVGHA